MTTLKTFNYIFVAISGWLLLCLPLCAQKESVEKSSQSSSNQPLRGIQYVTAITPTDSLPLLTGFSVGIDIVAPIRAVASSQGGYEGIVRANLRHRWFPLGEAGYGVCNYTDETSALHFKTAAPYLRIGFDYNFNKDRQSGNRILGGLRLAGTAFQYELTGPPLIDPIWGGSNDYYFTKQKSAALWGEIVFGLEAKVWKKLHLGWSLRYKRRIAHQTAAAGKAWHLPGYGKNDTSAFGATFHITIDL